MSKATGANTENIYDIVSIFTTLVSQNMAVPVAAMNALVEKIKESKASTWMQLEQELRFTIEILKSCSQDDLGGRSNISLGSGCDIFMKYVTRSFNLEHMDFDSCRLELLSRGERFATMSLSSRAQIAEIGHSFIQDDCTVLIHGSSRVVNSLVMKAAESKKFNIIVTEGRPTNEGAEHARRFREVGIPTKVITDSAVGAFMEEVDLCLVGAEGVMENGGIVNKIGTYQMALVAHALKKPFYVAVESYKFARMYPLSQRDIRDMSHSMATCSSEGHLMKHTDEEELTATTVRGIVTGADIVSKDIPSIDFTPANLITLLFTDLGVLTPAAVSDELIRLYQ